MICTIGGIKGGTGKTTVATNFAVISAVAGRKLLLVDADDQQTASDFTAARNQDHPDLPSYTCIRLTGKNVRSEIQKIAGDYQDVIIDTGGRDTTSQRSALSLSDLLLVPFAPRSFDVWTMGQVISLVDDMAAVNPKLKAFAFLNHADSQGTENTDSAAILKDSASLIFLDAPLGRRKAFSHAASEGLSVTELQRPHRNQQAIDEVMTLYRRCCDVTGTVNVTSRKKGVSY